MGPRLTVTLEKPNGPPRCSRHQRIARTKAAPTHSFHRASRKRAERAAMPRPTVRSRARGTSRIHGTGSNGRRRGQQRRRRRRARECGRRAGSGSNVAAGAKGRAGGGGARAAALLHRAPRAQARRLRLAALVVSRNPVLLPSSRGIHTLYCSSK